MKQCVILTIIAFLSVSCKNEPTAIEEENKVINTINRIRFENTVNDSVAILCDGKFRGLDFNDSVVTTLNSTVEFIDFNNSQLNNELVAFTADRKPLMIENINWHANLDTILTFENPDTLMATGWVLYNGNTTFEYNSGRILRGMQDCNRIFAHEGAGIQFDLRLVDVSGKEGVINHYNIRTLSDMEAASAFVDAGSDRLSLFFTRYVAGKAQSAFTTFLMSDSDNHIAFGMHAVDGGVIAHEIAHTFTLLHYDHEIIGLHNIMSDLTNLARVYFTEGQIHHMWYNDESSLFTVYQFPAPERVSNEIFRPDPYPSVWDDIYKRPYFDIYVDNDVIK